MAPEVIARQQYSTEVSIVPLVAIVIQDKRHTLEARLIPHLSVVSRRCFSWGVVLCP